MKGLFPNKENAIEVEPLLATRKSKRLTSSSEDDATVAAVASRGPLKTLLSPLSAALSCQTPAAASLVATPTSVCSSGSTIPFSSPEASPIPIQDQREEIRRHPLHGAIAKGMVLPGARQRRGGHYRGHGSGSKRATNQEKGGRKDPSYRRDICPRDSPTAITLKKRSSMLSEYRSPLDSCGAERCESEDMDTKKTRSERLARVHARSYDCGAFKNTLENVNENFRLKPSHVKSNRRQHTRERTSTYPGMMPSTTSRQEVELKCPVDSHDASMRSLSQQRENKPSNNKKKSAPVDVDKVPRSFPLDNMKHRIERCKSPGRTTTRQSSRTSSPGKERTVSSRSLNDVQCKIPACGYPRESSQISIPSQEKGRMQLSASRSVPTELCEIEQAQLDTERLLSQMGMDVAEEGEFGTPSRGDCGNRGRCHSYDCNYNHPLEKEYENFGVERKLVEFRNPSPTERDSNDKNKNTRGIRSMNRTVRHGLKNVGNDNRSDGDVASNRKHDHEHQVHDARPSSNKALRAKALSLLRGKGAKGRVPEQVVATTITPAITPAPSEEDGRDVDVEMTLEDVQLLHRWQLARSGLRGVTGRILVAEAPMTTTNAAIPGGRDKEDVMSVADSCGDKTLPVDNRRRRHAMGCSL